MDGLNDYLFDPLWWACLVLLDHIDTDNSEQTTESYITDTLDGIFEFIEASFDEEGIDCPSKSKIIKRTMQTLVDDDGDA